MVYLQNTTDAQVLMIPRDGNRESGILSLKVRNTTDQQKFTLEVSDLETSDHYFNLAVTLPEELPTGEYEYSLEKDGIRFSQGLLMIGDFSSPSQYETAINYQQYGTEE